MSAVQWLCRKQQLPREKALFDPLEGTCSPTDFFHSFMHTCACTLQQSRTLTATVSRKDPNLPPLSTCSGPGEPIVFYVNVREYVLEDACWCL
jgi:hypothetical protein